MCYVAGKLLIKGIIKQSLMVLQPSSQSTKHEKERHMGIVIMNGKHSDISALGKLKDCIEKETKKAKPKND